MGFEKVIERAQTRFWILWRDGSISPSMFSFDRKGATDAEKGIKDFEVRVLGKKTDWVLCLAYDNVPNNKSVLHCYKDGNLARLPFNPKSEAPLKAYVVYTNLYKYETGKTKGDTHYIADIEQDCAKLWNKNVQRIQLYENTPQNRHLFNYVNGLLEEVRHG